MDLNEALDIALEIKRGRKRLLDVPIETRGAVRSALNDELLLATHARTKEQIAPRTSRFTFARPRQAAG
jgi:hypothetical protein